MTDLSSMMYSHSPTNNEHHGEGVCHSPLTPDSPWYSEMWRVPSSASITYEVEMPGGVLLETLVYSDHPNKGRGKRVEMPGPMDSSETCMRTPLPPISSLSHSRPMHSVDPHLLPDLGFNYEQLQMPTTSLIIATSTSLSLDDNPHFSLSNSSSPFQLENTSPLSLTELHPQLHQMTPSSPQQLPTNLHARPAMIEQSASPPKHEVIRYKREDMCTSPLIPVVRKPVVKASVKKQTRRTSAPYPRRSREEIMESPRSSTSSASPTSALLLPSDLGRDPTPPPLADLIHQHRKEEDTDLSLPSPDMLNSMIQGLHSGKRF